MLLPQESADNITVVTCADRDMQMCHIKSPLLERIKEIHGIESNDQLLLVDDNKDNITHIKEAGYKGIDAKKAGDEYFSGIKTFNENTAINHSSTIPPTPPRTTSLGTNKQHATNQNSSSNNKASQPLETNTQQHSVLSKMINAVIKLITSAINTITGHTKDNQQSPHIGETAVNNSKNHLTKITKKDLAQAKEHGANLRNSPEALNNSNTPPQQPEANKGSSMSR